MIYTISIKYYNYFINYCEKNIAKNKHDLIILWSNSLNENKNFISFEFHIFQIYIWILFYFLAKRINLSANNLQNSDNSPNFSFYH